MECSLTSQSNSSPSFSVGLTFGFAAYLLWGGFPLYFMLVDELPLLVIVASRVLFALFFLIVIITLSHRWDEVRILIRNRRALGLSVLAGLILVTNWSIYVYAVISGHVIDASLGYFINPLMTVLLAVLVVRETLGRSQWTALALAAVGVAIITVAAGAIPIIGLSLALTFAVYGLIRKSIPTTASAGLFVETLGATPIALVYFLFTWTTFQQTADIPQAVALLALAGPVTVLPLLAFGGAVNRLPLSVVGMLQYTTPTMIFLLGLLFFNEEVLLGEWIGFLFIWIALTIFTTASLNKARRRQLVDTSETHIA